MPALPKLMGQPFTTIRRDIAHVCFDPDAPRKRPQLAAMVMEYLATWSLCEALFGAMLSTMLKADFKITTRMFLRIHSADARKKMLREAANESLASDPDTRELFLAVIDSIGTAESHRNDFSHHVWGIHPEMPDALLLIDPKSYNSVHIYIAEYNAGAAAKQRSDNYAIDAEALMVFREPDLRSELNIVSKAYNRLRTMHTVLTKHSKGEAFAKWRDALVADPEIRYPKPTP